MLLHLLRLSLALLLLPLSLGARGPAPSADAKVLRVFIFAGQSNMVGADSDAAQIDRFPPFRGLGEPRPGVRFYHCIGRENKTLSEGWVDLQPVKGMVGPELSFAKCVGDHISDPIAIIKVAAGGTTLAVDWNPENPGGFELYPLALGHVKSALAALDGQGVRYRLEGFMWHQGENDMFSDEGKANYASNLAGFMARWRKDLEAPELPFFVGELCTNTVWGMDHRVNMHAIEKAQRAATDADPRAVYVPTSHVAVKIGGQAGLHYHYGTLGQLEHGVSHARAYLESIGQPLEDPRPLKRWPYRKGEKVKLFVVAGHRNMEGERAFTEDLLQVPGKKRLAKDDGSIAYRYSVGGGYRVSEGWEPLGPAGAHGTFGPELSLAAALKRGRLGPFAVAKFTHGGSQAIDWTPGGSEAPTRNLYPAFLEFVRTSVAELEAKGHTVELAGIFYHLGENDTAWWPFRKAQAARFAELVAGLRKDLDLPELRWVVSQQRPASFEGLDKFDAVAAVETVAASDPHLDQLVLKGLPEEGAKLVLKAAGVVMLGERLAAFFLGKGQ